MDLERVLNTHKGHVIQQTLIIEQSFGSCPRKGMELRVKSTPVMPRCSVTAEILQTPALARDELFCSRHLSPGGWWEGCFSSV